MGYARVFPNPPVSTAVQDLPHGSAFVFVCAFFFSIVWRAIRGDRGHERRVRGRNCTVVGIKWDRRRTGSCFRGMGSVGSAGVQVRVIKHVVWVHGPLLTLRMYIEHSYI